VVEVTVRRHWILGGADDVSVEGFTMKHAANDAQRGALQNGGHSDWTIQDNVLSDAHGAVVSLTEGTDLELVGNDISRGGQLGVHGARADAIVRNNEIHHNNTEGFSTEWEAGALKMVTTSRLVAEGNEVHSNDGPGLWCDLGCTNVIYSDNRVYHNSWAGLLFEISDGAEIFSNTVYENGRKYGDWAWGAGILSSSSRNVEIHNNTLAWNADGISVISQDRAGHTDVSNVRVHHNVILMRDHPEIGKYRNLSLAWLQDWAGGMFSASSNNWGANNRYWYPSSEDSSERFAWDNRTIRELPEFNATPGENDGRYVSDLQKDQIASSARLPASPEPFE
jgi:parallel beta-helix repeat protein